MRVRLNGSDKEFDDGTTVSAVVQRFGRGVRGIAVALNGEVVSRSDWNDIKLADGDRVEVLGAIGGGEQVMESWTIPW
ncbi:MAG: sulfur carrier protein ThiS [Actinomycetota bacterium]